MQDRRSGGAAWTSPAAAATCLAGVRPRRQQSCQLRNSCIHCCRARCRIAQQMPRHGERRKMWRRCEERCRAAPGQPPTCLASQTIPSRSAVGTSPTAIQVLRGCRAGAAGDAEPTVATRVAAPVEGRSTTPPAAYQLANFMNRHSRMNCSEAASRHKPCRPLLLLLLLPSPSIMVLHALCSGGGGRAPQLERLPTHRPLVVIPSGLKNGHYLPQSAPWSQQNPPTRFRRTLAPPASRRFRQVRFTATCRWIMRGGGASRTVLAVRRRRRHRCPCSCAPHAHQHTVRTCPCAPPPPVLLPLRLPTACRRVHHHKPADPPPCRRRHPSPAAWSVPLAATIWHSQWLPSPPPAVCRAGVPAAAGPHWWLAWAMPLCLAWAALRSVYV